MTCWKKSGCSQHYAKGSIVSLNKSLLSYAAEEILHKYCIGGSVPPNNMGMRVDLQNEICKRA
jgi:hypothetical protein